MCLLHSEEVPRIWIHVGIHVSYQGSGVMDLCWNPCELSGEWGKEEWASGNPQTIKFACVRGLCKAEINIAYV